MSKKQFLAAFAMVPLLGIVVVIATYFHDGMRGATVPDEVLAEHRPNEVPVDGYTSSSECQSCHEQNYESWHASYHRTMTQLPTAESVHADFSHVSLNFDGRSYELERRGDQFWAVMHDPDQPLDRAHPDATRVERPMVLVTGSHHMQLFWYATGNSRVLGLLPVHYLKEENKWLPARATLLRPTDEHFSSETGRWNQRCLQCHATHPRSRPTDDSGMDSQVAEYGISCEACHGPGEKHVRQRRQKTLAEPNPEDPIVNPATLAPKTASQICGLCHSYTLAKSTTSELHEMTHGFFYRPGQQLTDSLFIVRRDEATRLHLQKFNINPDTHFEERFWSDGMVRVAGREFNGMIDSPCHLRGDLSCLSCHTMHKPKDDPRTLKQWADRQLKHGMDGDQACLQCHAADKFASDSHTHHAASSEGSRCYNCHMPHTTYGLLRAMRSHQIESPSAVVTKKTGRPNGCNLCHLDKTLAWTSEHLTNWYGQMKPDLSEDEKSISAAVRWALSGDAGQRAIVGWNMGWPPARQASGEDWLAPLLAQLMRDDYDTVRMVGYRSLRKLKGFEDVSFDFVAPPAEREPVVAEVRERWNSAHASRPAPRPEVLINDDGALQRDLFQRLLNQRNRRPVVLLE